MGEELLNSPCLWRRWEVCQGEARSQAQIKIILRVYKNKTQPEWERKLGKERPSGTFQKTRLVSDSAVYIGMWWQRVGVWTEEALTECKVNGLAKIRSYIIWCEHEPCTPCWKDHFPTWIILATLSEINWLIIWAFLQPGICFSKLNVSFYISGTSSGHLNY